jgi:hypothetical protein
MPGLRRSVNVPLCLIEAVEMEGFGDRQDGSQLSPARQGRQAPSLQFDLRTGLTCVPVPSQVLPRDQSSHRQLGAAEHEKLGGTLGHSGDPQRHELGRTGPARTGLPPVRRRSDGLSRVVQRRVSAALRGRPSSRLTRACSNGMGTSASSSSARVKALSASDASPPATARLSGGTKGGVARG